jgi:exodeoxyribonuclease VII large subunit
MRATPRILRVTDLNRRVRSLLDADAVLADVWVEGEVSQPSFPPSGHCFFTLKDANSQVRAALFREELGRAPVRPVHGMQVIVHGRVRAYEPQGVYQLYVESLTPAGAGDLHARYEQLRTELAAAGLFDDDRKRTVPRWPRRIGVVTSPVGAVWRDIGNVLRRRYPLVGLVLSPSVVQGVTAAPAIVRALQRLYAQPDLDTIILARGGGSLEDLWSFNDERVVRAVADAPVPIIVGVGHESDVTLADFAADLRAPTPSAAAELATPDGTSSPPSSPASATEPRQRSSAAPRSSAASSIRSPGPWHGWRRTSAPPGNGQPTWWIGAAGLSRIGSSDAGWASRRWRTRCAPSRRPRRSSAAMRWPAPPTAASCATQPP